MKTIKIGKFADVLGIKKPGIVFTKGQIVGCDCCNDAYKSVGPFESALCDLGIRHEHVVIGQGEDSLGCGVRWNLRRVKITEDVSCEA